MKAYIVQPFYSLKEEDLETCFSEMISLLDSVEEDADIIVLPEYCDIPSACRTKDSFHNSIETYNERIKEKAIQTAKRCHALLFFNAADRTSTGWRNTTHAIDREGNVVYRYYKAHPAPSEVKTEKEGGKEVDVSYSYQFRQPDVVEIEGIRFGFMTCYDFYFYESFAPLALQNIDVIIGCSHQRTDPHEALSIINRFLSYHTNAYLIRSSVSLGEESPVGGCSTVIAPDGQVLVDLKSKVGIASVEFDPHKKYRKPAGFGGQTKAHYEYIEEGRRPWLYRNGGASVVPFDRVMPYPRLCAHRGYHAMAPENTMPSFGAAVAMGAQEMEFDLWSTSDGELVTAHDRKLERVSNGTGFVNECSLSELKSLDFGVKFGQVYENLRIPTFEEILAKFAGRVVMNIHVKIWDKNQDDRKIEQIASLIEKYDCVRHVYFMSSNTDALIEMRKRLPDAGYCQGSKDGHEKMVEAAIENGFDKVQFVSWHPFDPAMVERCHEHSIRCNFCQANDAKLAKELFALGIDCVLTDDFHRVQSDLQTL